MRKLNLSLLVFSLALAFSFQSCVQDTCERQVTYTRYTPVYKSLEEIHAGQIANETPKELTKPGKIYFYNNYIFINENKEGVHVIDNSNPESPQNITFISIPGNEDIAVRNGILYANSYVDLLAINITDIQNASIASRTESVFPPIWEDIQNERVLVEYKEEQVTDILDCETLSLLGTNPYSGGYYDCFNCRFNNASFESILANVDANVPTGSSSGSGSNSGGVAGSMARFSIRSGHLYVVDNASLNIFNLTNAFDPQPVNTINLGWGIETIFPYQDKLFIGSNSGMFIYDNSNPAEPTLLSSFAHARACDPVFVKDNYAYVTLRDGNTCQGFNNQLDLVDITDLTAPVLVKSFAMTNPHGLSIKDNTLFICEGESGLKSFDITDPLKIDENLLDHEKDFFAYDAISLAVPNYENTVLVVGKDGFYQFNFDDPANLQLISLIEVK